MKPPFKLPRFARLLPLVVLALAALLVLNGTGLLRDGVALAETAANALSEAQAAPANRDFAEPDQQISTANEADIVTSLARRRAELDAREAQLKVQGEILKAAEKRMDAKIAQLQALQAKMDGLMQTHDDQQKAQIAALTKTYTTMPGKKSGPLFANLPDEVAVPVAQSMKPAELSQILQNMPADAAQKLTVKLASRLALPQTADAPAPAAAATPAAPAAAPAAAAPAPKKQP